MNFPPPAPRGSLSLLLAILLPLCPSGLSHEELNLDPTQKYHLLPEDLIAEAHPSRQVGYRSEEVSTTEHQNGILKFFSPAPNFEPVQGTTKGKRVISKTIENLPASIIRYQRKNSQKNTSIIQGEEYKETEPDLLQGQALLIDMSGQEPLISFENAEIQPSPEQAQFIEDLIKEYRAQKQANPWRADELSYGKTPRTVGEIWSLEQQELESLSKWITQVQLVNQGEYRLKSLVIEFLELKEINHLPYAVLELRGEFSVTNLSSDEETTSNSQGSFTTRVERDLVHFIETSTSMESSSEFEMLREDPQGNKMQLNSDLLMKVSEKNSLPSTRKAADH